MSEPRRIAVVGGGIAGLAAAYEAARQPVWQPTLFEASGRLGGIVETVQQDGFTVECGPDAWVSDRSAARDLAVELGLGDELICSNDATRRTYLARGPELTPMPDGMRMMVPTRWAPILESPLFSWQARLAYLREPKRAAELRAWAQARGADEDESVRAFVVRHFGEEATQTVAGPLLAGVFGGNIDTLSAGAVLAPFVAMEREHGSLIAPMMKRAQAQAEQGVAPQPIFTTLRSGLGTLIAKIAAALPHGTVRLQAPVEALRRTDDGRWAVRVHGEEELFEAVVLATPFDGTHRLLQPLDREAADLLPAEATSAVVAALCFEEAAARSIRVPRGFGFLALPSAVLGQNGSPQLLAGTFMHQKFPHRTPAGGVFLRGFFGDDAARRMQGEDDETIAAQAHARFSSLLGPLPRASFTVVRRWPRSLPQYAVGHPARMRRLAARVEALSGLALAGNAYHGVGLPALVEHGRAAASSLTGVASR